MDSFFLKDILDDSNEHTLNREIKLGNLFFKNEKVYYNDVEVGVSDDTKKIIEKYTRELKIRKINK